MPLGLSCGRKVKQFQSDFVNERKKKKTSSAFKVLTIVRKTRFVMREETSHSALDVTLYFL